ncbi:hypothetical protein [Streptomyces sp. NPDC001507]|uniref:hypothetical protein n=1 Tax=Streptomyces sp. NPDC001507 TaxID=3364579 RepID=UPI0036B6AC10
MLDSSFDDAEPPFPTVRVYALLDDAGRPVYVGVTTLNEENRAYRHWVRRHDTDIWRWNPRLAEWLSSLDAPPSVLLIYSAPYDQRHTAEGAAVLAYRQAGYLLPLNIRIGQHWPDEARARISEGMRRHHAQRRELASA